ncbi:MAG: prolyl oligopeptidase family serine peptidase [Anaerolineae bacterium]|nr:prolyl oligopeptidase family serine peptidase [Anaerolineae bacterium]
MSMEAHTITKQFTTTQQLKYWLFLPQGYDQEQQKNWPLILYLHGIGSRGDDLEMLKKNGIPKIVQTYEDFPFIAIAPLCPMYTRWSNHIEILGALLDGIADKYKVDEDRVYVTGLSMGGFGTWHMALAYPHRFAAIAPICGGGKKYLGFPERTCEFRHLPIWVFHGTQDKIVPIEESVCMVEALKACDGKVRFTVYPNGTHDVWTETYDNPELYTWFLQHQRTNK